MSNKITLITLDYPPERGGVARYLSGLVKASNGAIRVIVEKNTGTDGVEEAEMFRSGWPSWRPLIGICKAEKRRADVVLVSHVFPVGTAAWISKLIGGPDYAVIVHGLDVRLVYGAWKRWLFTHVCKNAKTVIVNSEATRRDVQERVPGLTTCVITPGIEEIQFLSREQARQKLGIDPNAELVVSVARLVPRKGIDVSLKVMARVQSKRNVSYVVIGDGPDLERLEGIARDVRTEVIWIRNADDDEMHAWLAAADIFLLPVRDEGDDVEGFGIVYLEAALAGLPSIAGRSGGAPEAVIHERTGLVVRPDSVDEVTDAVEKLLHDPEMRRRMGEEGRRRVLKDFQWKERWLVLLRFFG
jgi:phosphatidylinositol alpha-1,6-mannosyltransferase